MVAGYWDAGDGRRYIMSELFLRAVVELLKDRLELRILL